MSIATAASETNAFDARSLENQYAAYDRCPSALYDDVVTLPIGTPDERVDAVLRWQAALLQGQLPELGDWPSPELEQPSRQLVQATGVLTYCKDQPELVYLLLKDTVLPMWADGATQYGERVQQEFERILRSIRERLPEAADLADELQDWNPDWDHLSEVPAGVRGRILALAKNCAAANPDIYVSRRSGTMYAAWAERVRVWSEISDVLGDLGNMLGSGRGMDLSRSVLRHSGWKDMQRLSELLKKLPQLRKVIQQMGRMQDSDAEMESVSEQIMRPVSRIEVERQEIPTDVPIETKDIERSDEISRMLPSEAILLGHPKLHLLWHAKRAERALFTYRRVGTDVREIEHQRIDMVSDTQERQRPRPERGPIMAVIDTSGSMSGKPELVAKALVLEAVRTAHMEKRKCYLYLFSWGNNVLELDLSVTDAGLGRLMDFLGQSFGGGSDVDAMNLVVERLKQPDWVKADVILVSDGEWSPSQSVLNGVTNAKQNGTRFHGVQIGNGSGMQMICDPIHRFQDWMLGRVPES